MKPIVRPPTFDRMTTETEHISDKYVNIISNAESKLFQFVNLMSRLFIVHKSSLKWLVPCLTGLLVTLSYVIEIVVRIWLVVYSINLYSFGFIALFSYVVFVYRSHLATTFGLHKHKLTPIFSQINIKYLNGFLIVLIVVFMVIFYLQVCSFYQLNDQITRMRPKSRPPSNKSIKPDNESAPETNQSLQWPVVNLTFEQYKANALVYDELFKNIKIYRNHESTTRPSKVPNQKFCKQSKLSALLKTGESKYHREVLLANEKTQLTTYATWSFIFKLTLCIYLVLFAAYFVLLKMLKQTHTIKEAKHLYVKNSGLYSRKIVPNRIQLKSNRIRSNKYFERFKPANDGEFGMFGSSDQTQANGPSVDYFKLILFWFLFENHRNIMRNIADRLTQICNFWPVLKVSLIEFLFRFVCSNSAFRYPNSNKTCSKLMSLVKNGIY